MSYIQRTMEPLIRSLMQEYSAILITGPRQVGKSTLLQHILGQENQSISQVTLHDLTERQLAISDPAMFFQLHQPPVLIDEVQYAPELFSYIKIMIDQEAPAGSFLLTSSQQFSSFDSNTSLAGRVTILQLSSITQGELDTCVEQPFSLDLTYWMEREKLIAPKSILSIFNEIQQGSMPALVDGRFSNSGIYYASYIQTYIERDVRRLLGDVDAIQFSDFIRAVAARCSQTLNVASIARDVGIRPDKAKLWLSVLEKSGIIFYLHPYSNNQLKRTVKFPKLYCHDCGLIAYLTKWSSPETMEAGAMAGAFLENFVVSQIWKSYLNAGIDAPLYYYRDHDVKEIDLIIEADGKLHPLEIKKTATPQKSMVKNFSVLDRSSVPRGTGALICASEKVSALDSDTLVIPIGLL